MEYLDQTFHDKKLLNINRLKDIPKDYEGYMCVPCTVIFSNYTLLDDMAFFGIFNHATAYTFANRIDIYTTDDDPSINGRNIYTRFIVKWKRYCSQAELNYKYSEDTFYQPNTLF